MPNSSSDTGENQAHSAVHISMQSRLTLIALLAILKLDVYRLECNNMPYVVKSVELSARARGKTQSVLATASIEGFKRATIHVGRDDNETDCFTLRPSGGGEAPGAPKIVELKNPVNYRANSVAYVIGRRTVELLEKLEYPVVLPYAVPLGEDDDVILFFLDRQVSVKEMNMKVKAFLYGKLPQNILYSAGESSSKQKFWSEVSRMYQDFQLWGQSRVLGD
jgi:hypothetical protein